VSHIVKRSLDLVGAAIAIVLLSPIMAISVLLVRLMMGSPVLFLQERSGLDGQRFWLFKLRTMTAPSGGGWSNQPDELLITPLGEKLRQSSIDELPELWNVLKGDMSLVGPRPLLAEYLPLYSDHHARRHDVRPGITGLAQVLDRNDTTWEKRLDMDVWYIEHQSLWLDLRILLLTVGKVLSMSGIVAEGSATMPRFEGSQTPRAE
jgi:sugar transferase EpsL